MCVGISVCVYSYAHMYVCMCVCICVDTWYFVSTLHAADIVYFKDEEGVLEREKRYQTIIKNEAKTYNGNTEHVCENK